MLQYATLPQNTLLENPRIFPITIDNKVT